MTGWIPSKKGDSILSQVLPTLLQLYKMQFWDLYRAYVKFLIKFIVYIKYCWQVSSPVLNQVSLHVLYAAIHIADTS